MLFFYKCKISILHILLLQLFSTHCNQFQENINNNIDITTELKKEMLSTFNIIINLNENTKYKRIKKVKFENSEKEDFSIETLFY